MPGIIYAGNDLDAYFALYVGGNQSGQTGFRVNGVDLAQRYQSVNAANGYVNGGTGAAIALFIGGTSIGNLFVARGAAYRTTSVALSRNTTTYFNTVFAVCCEEGTLIRLPDGRDVPVETLSVGRLVKSMDIPGLVPELMDPTDYLRFETESLEGSKLVDTSITSFKRDTVSTLYQIELEGYDQPQRVTPSHPFLIETPEGTYQFCSADQLTVDDRVINSKQEPVTIRSIERVHGTFTIYKIDCAPFDLFIHGDIIGHNAKPGGNHNTSVQTSNVTLTSWTSTYNTNVG